MWTIIIGALTTLAAGQCSDNCLNCNFASDPDTCISCSGGLFPLVGSCVECDQQPMQCSSCGGGAWNCACSDPESNNNCGECPGDCSHCLEGSDAICNVCFNGYFLNSQNECETCLPQCTSCTGIDKCTGCVDGYYVVDGYCCQKGCLRCDADQCLLCETGLVLVGGHCIDRECPDGTFYNGKDCEKCAENCKRCDESGCIECANGMGNENGNCIVCVTAPCGLCQRDCLDCKENVCVKCVDGSILSPTGVCAGKECLIGCLAMGPNGFCIKCDKGYQLLVKFKDEGCCVPICPHDRCAVVSWTGACKECYYGYYLSDKCCVPKCPNSEVCIFYDIWGWCQKCKQGYYLHQSGCCVKNCCKASLKGCSRVDVYGNCVDCYQGWGLTADGCCLPRCTNGHLLYYSTTSGALCFKCENGYTQLQNGCCGTRC